MGGWQFCRKLWNIQISTKILLLWWRCLFLFLYIIKRLGVESIELKQPIMNLMFIATWKQALMDMQVFYCLIYNIQSNSLKIFGRSCESRILKKLGLILKWLILLYSNFLERLWRCNHRDRVFSKGFSDLAWTGLYLRALSWWSCNVSEFRACCLRSQLYRLCDLYWF